MGMVQAIAKNAGFIAFASNQADESTLGLGGKIQIVVAAIFPLHR